MTLQPSISDYGIIGDCRSAALVSTSGSIDWLCWPTFSSDAVFSRLLDAENGGVWSVTPAGTFSSRRRYMGKTNVLETTFDTGSGSLSLTDFMPVASENFKRHHLLAAHQITRILRCDRGRVELRIVFTPSSGFDPPRPVIVDKKALGLRADVKCGMLTLQSNLSWTVTGAEARSALSMRAGESCNLILTLSSEGPAVLPPAETAAADLARTLAWWEGWSSKFSYQGPYAAAVQRSVLTLKLLQFAPTGAFVAAATTSLPEKLGGNLNWDYRYCWLRDASFNVQALWETGYRDEAEAFMEWMLHATRLTQPKLMVMYDLFGNIAPKEKEFPRLPGFGASQPVRTGNLARTQHQLDTYGEVVCGAAKIIKSRGFADRETQRVLVQFGSFVASHWRDPDAGIWESRDQPSIHTHSRLLCWVALDELLKMNEKGLVHKMPVDLFRNTRAAIRRDIEQTCWRKDWRSYTSRPGECELDATLLLLAVHNFDLADSERMQLTYKKISEVLHAGTGLLYRNRLQSGPPVEGAFGICGFWAAEFLAMGGGALEEAQARFESLLHYANDLGLYAEETEPATGAALGNFPQTFTHVGLINAALALRERASRTRASS